MLWRERKYLIGVAPAHEKFLLFQIHPQIWATISTKAEVREAHIWMDNSVQHGWMTVRTMDEQHVATWMCNLLQTELIRKHFHFLYVFLPSTIKNHIKTNAF